VVRDYEHTLVLTADELDTVVDALYVFKQTRMGYGQPLPDRVEVLRRRLLLIQVGVARDDGTTAWGHAHPPEST